MERIETGRIALVPSAESAQFDICELQDNRVIGCVGIGSLSGEIFVRIDEDHRGQGYGTRAAKAIVWHALQNLHMDVIRARVEPWNLPARRILDKLGFVEWAGKWRFYHTDHLPGPDWDWRAVARPEEMGAFFDARAESYDAHMFSFGGGGSYAKLGACLPATDRPIRVLDIGCGTGIELDYIWEKAPRAFVTCVDLSRGVLDLLLENHRAHADQIEVVEASYVDWPYPPRAFDLALSSNTMHHFWEDEKAGIYKKIRASLVLHPPQNLRLRRPLSPLALSLSA